MKTNSSSAKQGVALVIVLVFVVLLSVFILSFFTNSQNELSASQSFSGEISAHQLAETATSVIMGQIREATTRPGVAWASQPGMIRNYGGATANDKASGFFKLYSSDDMIIGPQELSAFLSDYKDTKKLGGEIPIDPNPEGQTGWDSQPALFTDINSPITLAEPAPSGETVVKFPIIDGHDIRLIQLPKINAQPSTETPAPILSYDAVNSKGERKPDGVPDIEGFAIDPKTVKYTEPTPDVPLSPSNTPVPMPVRWMYVLRDGTLTVPKESQQDEMSKLLTRAVWDDSSKKRPTKDNPIVGRIAFWTDDDTCKVNINTAGGFNYKDVDPSAYKTERAFAGSYWDQPRTFTKFDYGLAEDDNRNKGQDGKVISGGLSITQPIAKEFQRYPGHPATTSLGLLFKDLLNSEQLYSILPRLNNRGTRGGTERIYADNSDIDLPEGQDEEEYTTPLEPKRDRLFASVDEFLFGRRLKDEDTFRPLNDFSLMTNPSLIDKRLGGKTYNDQLKPGQAAVTPEILERMRFFLTAHSRAPELNLFGRPRVTIWPSYPDETRLTAPDRLLNFCSIIGPRTRADGTNVPASEVKLFQFQRIDPYSPTNDFNGKKPTLGRMQMPTTASGGTRNEFLYRYLQELTDTRFPGFSGGTFADKYPKGDRDQILTTMFDYMRTVNLRDSTRDKLLSVNPKKPTAPEFKAMEKFKYAPLGVVVPIQISTNGNDTRGFGRFPTISEAALVLYHTGYMTRALSGPRGGAPVHFTNLEKMNDEIERVTKKRPVGKAMVHYNTISAFVVFETFNPMFGYAPTRALDTKSDDRVRYAIDVTGLDGFTVLQAGSPEILNNRGSFGFPADGTSHFNGTSGSYYHGRNMGGSEGYGHTLLGNWDENARVWVPHKWGVVKSSKPGDHYYPFQGDWPGVAIKAPATPEPALIPDGTIDTDGDKIADYYEWHDPKTNSGKWQYLSISGAKLTVKIRFGQQGDSPEAKSEPVVRTLSMEFPPAIVPMPTDLSWSDPGGFIVHPADTDAAENMEKGKNGRWTSSPVVQKNIYGEVRINPDGIKRFGDRLWAYPGTKNVNTWKDRIRYGGVLDSEGNDNQSGAPKPGLNNTNRWRQMIQPGDTVRSVLIGRDGADLRIAAVNDEQSANLFQPHPYYGNQEVRHAQALRTAAGPSYLPGITVTAMPPDPLTIPVATGKIGGANDSWRNDDSIAYYAATRYGKLATLPANVGYAGNAAPDLPPNINGIRFSTKDGAPKTTGDEFGDFETGLGNIPDGAFTGKADEGNPVFRRQQSYTADDGSTVKYWVYPHPYFNWDYEETFDTFFTPNRQTPSAVVFGSLPLGKNAHWQTLAFSPFSAMEAADPSGRKRHPGRNPDFHSDHLLLDLFNMPIVEPYAISEPFSTAGKVNLNYPMMPFANIERSTALRAALHSVRVTAFPTVDANVYKSAVPNVSPAEGRDVNYRYPVDRNMTIRAFREFFDKFKTDVNAGLFKSATEICDRGLYPLETPNEGVRAGGPIKVTLPNYNKDPDFYLKTQFWKSNALTGDNIREKPYSDLYPRLTTKSNTYTVHVKAQSLRQTPQSAEKGIWDEKKDRVIGEYRGSSTIERFIDPEDARFDPKSTVVDQKDKIDVDKESLEEAYRFRVISTKRFVP